MKNVPILLVALTATATLATAGLPDLAQDAPSATYVGATVLVAKEAKLDNGVIVCSRNGPGIGGACIPFGQGPSIAVKDAALGSKVAFQVCIDNNGDSVCSGPTGSACDDDIFFSHDDKGNFFNPLGPLPGGFRWRCNGGPWKGYVVFLCEGVHNAGGPHAHTATTGSIAPSPLAGTGFGDFCLPSPQPPAKRYVLV